MCHLKIGILINSFNLGGAEKLMYDIAETLADKGIKVFLISMKSAQTDFEKKVYSELLKKNKFEVLSVNKPVGGGKLKVIFEIAALIKKHKLSILHTNGQSPDFYGRMAILMCRKCKAVVTIHNTGGYSRKIEEIQQHFTGAYTAVSKQAKGYAYEDLGIKKDVKVIINGVDNKRYLRNNEEKNGKCILTVGRIMKQKGYVDIVKGMCEYLRNTPSGEWFVLGDKEQDKEYYNEFISQIDPDVKDRIHILGAVTDTEKYYKKADCFILASEFEGFGIVFIEAMIAGLPVVARNIGVIPEIVEMGGNFIELDTENVEKCIEEALKLDARTIDINKEICIKNYSIDAVTEQYIEIYKKCLK